MLNSIIEDIQELVSAQSDDENDVDLHMIDGEARRTTTVFGRVLTKFGWHSALVFGPCREHIRSSFREPPVFLNRNED
jgi:hypothetical protein